MGDQPERELSRMQRRVIGHHSDSPHLFPNPTRAPLTQHQLARAPRFDHSPLTSANRALTIRRDTIHPNRTPARVAVSQPHLLRRIRYEPVKRVRHIAPPQPTLILLGTQRTHTRHHPAQHEDQPPLHRGRIPPNVTHANLNHTTPSPFFPVIQHANVFTKCSLSSCADSSAPSRCFSA